MTIGSNMPRDEKSAYQERKKYILQEVNYVCNFWRLHRIWIWDWRVLTKHITQNIEEQSQGLQKPNNATNLVAQAR